MPPLGLGLGFARGPVSASAPSLILDSLSAGAAYSTRKLRTAYSGAALRVRRSSDNVEQDIGFSGNALDTTALTSFVGANSGFVVTWYDQSINARHVTQATQANQPRIVNAGTIDTRNSVPSLFFNGTSHHLFNSSPFLYAAGAATMIAVYSAAAVAATRIVCEGNSANTVTSYGLQAKNTASSAGLFVRTDAGVETVTLTANPNILNAFDSTFKQISIRDNASTIEGFLNGTAASPQGTYTRSGTLTFDRFVIGAYLRSAAAGFLSGYISEVICFPSFLSNADMNAVGASQGAAYGITVNPI